MAFARLPVLTKTAGYTPNDDSRGRMQTDGQSFPLVL